MDSLTLWIIVSVLAVLLLLALLTWYSWYTQPQPSRTVIETVKTTSRRLSPRELGQLTQGQFVELGLDLATHQPAILPEAVRFMNSLVLGPTGSGKTTFLVATYLWRDVANGENSVVVFDALGGLTESVQALAALYGREVVIFPDCGFNPLGGAGTASERANRFADIYGQSQEIAGGASEYYTAIAQQWIRCVVALYQRAYPGHPMILRELFELATSDLRREALFQAAGICPEMTDYLLQFESWARQETYTQHLSGLISFLSQIQTGNRRWLYNQRNAPTLEQAIERRQVIIIREGGFRNTLDRTLGLLFMVSLQEYIRNRTVTDSSHPVRVYLDEAHLYFNPNFPTLIATNRQKRTELILGFQALTQFEPYTDILTTNARTWIILPGLLYEDAVYIAQNIGMRQIENVSVSHTPGAPRHEVSQTRQLDYDYLIQPNRIRDMDEDAALVLSVQGRETKAPQLIKKPKPFALSVLPYQPPQAPDQYPPTIWDEEEQHARQARQPIPDPATAPAQPTHQQGIAAQAADATEAADAGEHPGQARLIPFETRRRQRHQGRTGRAGRGETGDDPTPPEPPPSPPPTAPGCAPDWE